MNTHMPNRGSGVDLSMPCTRRAMLCGLLAVLGQSSVVDGDDANNVRVENSIELPDVQLHSRRFANGLAAWRVEGKVGAIDCMGHLKVLAVYDAVLQFSEGVASALTREGWLLINKTGVPLSKLLFEEAPGLMRHGRSACKNAGKWGYLDSQGNWAIQPQFEAAYDFCEGLARVQKAGLWGYVDISGDWRIEAKYHAAGDFSEGCASVAISDRTVKGLQVREWNYVAPSGKAIFKPDVADCWGFREGLARFRIRKGYSLLYGFMDNTGNVSITPEWSYASDFSNGMSAIATQQGWGYMNKSGVVDIQPTFLRATEFSCGIARVVTKRGIYLIDLKGGILSGPFAEAGPSGEGVSIVSHNHRESIVFSNGKVMDPIIKK